MPLLPEEPEEITATALKQEYTNGFLAGQKKAYDECDEVARELSQIKSGCSKWLEEHDAKVRADAFREVDEKMADISAEKCEEYGVDCIEANADAFGELGDWLEEKLKEGVSDEV